MSLIMLRFAFDPFESEDLFPASEAPAPTDPPVISYTTPQTVDLNDTASLSPTNTGGASTDWEVVAGDALASFGLSLNPTTGAITGTYNAVGTFATTVRATNPDGSDDFEIDFEVANIAPVIAYPDPASVTIDRAASIQPSNAGGDVQAGGWTLTAGSLPSGLSLDADTGFITGTPDTLESQAVTVQAGNAEGTDSASFTITVRVASQDDTGVIARTAVRNALGRSAVSRSAFTGTRG